jgi:hypothetical protein
MCSSGFGGVTVFAAFRGAAFRGAAFVAFGRAFFAGARSGFADLVGLAATRATSFAASGCRRVAVAGARRDLTFFMTRSSLWLQLLRLFGVNSV